MRGLIPTSDSARPERNNFDAIRLAMALLVVWSHSFALHLGTEDSEPINVLMGGHFTGGTVAVMVFFIISGFLIAQSYDRSKSVTSYLEKRVRRIYPGYMVATTLCALVIVPLFATHVDISLIRVAKVTLQNLFLQGIFPPSDAFAGNPTDKVNGSLWTIPFEFGCYLFVLMLGARRKMSLIALVVVVLLARVGMDAFVKEPWLGLTHWPFLWSQLLPSFLLGMVAYSYRNQLPRNRALLVGSVLAAVLSCHISAHLANLIVAPALGYATFYAAFTDRIQLHNAAKNGDFSYGTYLYAFPIQQMLESLFGSTLGLPAFIGMSLSLSLVAGIASWHLVEARFMKRRAVRDLDPTPTPVIVG